MMEGFQQMTSDVLTWLSVRENQELVVVIIAILGFIGGFLVWFFGLFKRSSGGGQSASGGSANVASNVGGDVMTGGSKAEGGSAIVGRDVGTLTIGYAKAEPLFVEALEILRAKLGPDHPFTKKVEANYAAFLAQRDSAAPE